MEKAQSHLAKQENSITRGHITFYLWQGVLLGLEVMALSICYLELKASNVLKHRVTEYTINLLY